MKERLDVLVVDDEELVCDVYGRILDIDGHSYDLCADGEAAIALLESGRRYEIAVVDFVMPGIDGMQTAQRLHEIDPCMSIAFVTGTLVVKNLTGQAFRAPVLFKPFTPQDLRRLISELHQVPAA